MTGWNVLRILISVAMLILAWRIAGGEKVLSLLAHAQPHWLLLALALTVPMQVLSAMRWSFTSGRLGHPLPLGHALAEYYLASLMNMTFPGGVTGDAARIWRQGRRGSSLQSAAHGVLLERTAGQAAIVLVMLLGVAANPGLISALETPRWLIPAVSFLAALGALVFVAGRRWRPIRKLMEDARQAWWPGRILTVQLVLSLAIVATYLGIFAATGAALGTPLPAATALLAIPLVLTAMVLPISVGGTGPRELSAAALWPLLGMDAAAGAACALAYGLVVLVGSLPGAAMFSSRART